MAATDPREPTMAKHLLLKHYRGGPEQMPNQDLIAGWMIFDVDSTDRAHEVAAFLSSAPARDHSNAAVRAMARFRRSRRARY